MPRYNVQHPTNKNKWRAFSSIVDDYVTEWIDLEDYEKWRQDEYGKDCGSVFNANMMTFEEAEYTILTKKFAEDFDYGMTADEFNDSDYYIYEDELHNALENANKEVKEKYDELSTYQEVLKRIAAEIVEKK